MTRVERQRLDREVHRQLDMVYSLSRLISVATPRTDLERGTLDLLREALIQRLRQIQDAVRALPEPRRDRIRD
jgi:hypothetical protein